MYVSLHLNSMDMWYRIMEGLTSCHLRTDQPLISLSPRRDLQLLNIETAPLQIRIAPPYTRTAPLHIRTAPPHIRTAPLHIRTLFLQSLRYLITSTIVHTQSVVYHTRLSTWDTPPFSDGMWCVIRREHYSNCDFDTGWWRDWPTIISYWPWHTFYWPWQL